MLTNQLDRLIWVKDCVAECANGAAAGDAAARETDRSEVKGGPIDAR
jgi:hypothetical protein